VTQVLEIDSANLGFKFKPDSFDGSVPLREFLTQFDLITRKFLARFNESSRVGFEHKGKSRFSSSEEIFEIENFKFLKLKI